MSKNSLTLDDLRKLRLNMVELMSLKAMSHNNIVKPDPVNLAILDKISGMILEFETYELNLRNEKMNAVVGIWFCTEDKKNDDDEDDQK